MGGDTIEGAGSGERGAGSGSGEQGAGSREQGAGSREQGAGSREQGAGSREQGAGNWWLVVASWLLRREVEGAGYSAASEGAGGLGKRSRARAMRARDQSRLTERGAMSRSWAICSTESPPK